MQKLLIFGDSWPQGSELRYNQQPFGELLAQKLSVPVWNHAQPSTSIPHLILQLRSAINTTGPNRKFDHRGSDAIFFLTSPDRDLMWDKDGAKELHLNPNHPNDADVRYYSQIYTPQLAEFRVNSTLLVLQRFCAMHNINDHYVWGWQTIELWPEIDIAKFWRQGRSTILDLFAENDSVKFDGSLNDYIENRENWFVYPNRGHPNQRGHELIAQALREWLAPCT